jgi:hypothetical protein
MHLLSILRYPERVIELQFKIKLFQLNVFET